MGHRLKRHKMINSCIQEKEKYRENDTGRDDGDRMWEGGVIEQER